MKKGNILRELYYTIKTRSLPDSDKVIKYTTQLGEAIKKLGSDTPKAQDHVLKDASAVKTGRMIKQDGIKDHIDNQ